MVVSERLERYKQYAEEFGDIELLEIVKQAERVEGLENRLFSMIDSTEKKINQFTFENNLLQEQNEELKTTLRSYIKENSELRREVKP